MCGCTLELNKLLTCLLLLFEFVSYESQDESNLGILPQAPMKDTFQPFIQPSDQL